MFSRITTIGIVFLLLCFCSPGQSTFILKGKMHYFLSEFPIELALNIHSDFTVSGVSKIEVGGKYETHSLLYGNLTLNDSSIHVHETRNIYVKTKDQNSQFCYLNLIKITPNNTSDSIRVKYTGVDTAGESCAVGYIILKNSPQLFNYIQETQKSTVKKELPIIDLKSNNLEVLDATSMDTFKSPSKQIHFYVSDFGLSDNDRISIAFNGNEIVSNLELEKKDFKFSVDISSNKVDTLQIKCLNVGRLSPNTTRLVVYDDQLVKQYEVIGKTNEIIHFYLKKED